MAASGNFATMIIKPQVILARVYHKVEFKLRSLLYYGNSERFAAKYSPSVYPLWELGKGILRLTDQASRRRIVLEPALIQFQADLPDDILGLQRHITQITRKYFEALNKPEPARLGWCLEFVTPDTAFDDLYPTYATHFFGDASPPDAMFGLKHRDHQQVVEYGTVEDGLKLQAGVLTPKQATDFRQKLEFEGTTTERLPIDEGCLLIHLDRYTRDFRKTDAVTGLFDEHDKMVGAAKHLADMLFEPRDR